MLNTSFKKKKNNTKKCKAKDQALAKITFIFNFFVSVLNEDYLKTTSALTQSD